MKKIIQILSGLLVSSIVFASGEITLQGYLKAEKGYRKVDRVPGTINTDWIGNKYAGPIVYTAVTNSQPLPAVSFVTNGIMWIRNVSTNSAVTLSFDNGVTDHMQIKTNEFFMMRLAPAFNVTNINYKLTTSSTNYTGNDFEVLILEN